MSTSPIGNSSSTNQSSSSSSSSSNDPFKSLDLNSFLQLMVTEMQNQDPTNPMDSSQILQQISQMASISTTEQLSSSLNSVVLGQNLTTAGSLVSKYISGTDDTGASVFGQVASVSISNGVPKAVVGNQTVSLDNIKQILPN
jgi:flagellar basal-body rod modification protein FlgD